MSDDEKLKSAFDAMRTVDAAIAPPFQRMWRPRQRRVSWVLVPAVASLAAAATLVVCLGRTNAPVRSTPPSPIVIESEPLGFLLDPPASQTPALDDDQGVLR